MASGLPKVTVSVRLDPAIADELPRDKKGRAAFLRNAISAAVTERRVPAPEEIEQLRRLVRELRPIGQNINQVVHSMHFARQEGRDVEVSPQLEKLVDEALDQVAAARRVVGFWEGRGS